MKAKVFLGIRGLLGNAEFSIYVKFLIFFLYFFSLSVFLCPYSTTLPPFFLEGTCLRSVVKGVVLSGLLDLENGRIKDLVKPVVKRIPY